jgi:hypothetical protein
MSYWSLLTIYKSTYLKVNFTRKDIDGSREVTSTQVLTIRSISKSTILTTKKCFYKVISHKKNSKGM